MPLYEMIIICRIGETQAIGNLMRTLSVAIYNEGGVVRRFVNLGDRIPARSFKTKDDKWHSIARYISVSLFFLVNFRWNLMEIQIH